MLLAGGLGTRLRPLTYGTPKPLVPVANRALAWYPLRALWLSGVDSAVLAAGHLADKLATAFSERDPELPDVRVAEERKPLDTGGAVRHALPAADAPFYVMNGDQLIDVHLGALLAAHIEREADVTIVVRRVADVSAFGLVQCREDGSIEGFMEKRGADPMGQNLINAGLYVFSPGVLSAIPAGVSYSNERRLFPELIEAGKRVVAFRLPADAYWADVGTARNYLGANADVLSGALPWAGPTVMGAADVSAEATILEPVSIGPGCRIEAGATVGPCVSLGPGATVGEGSKVRNCVLWERAEIGRDCDLANAIVGRGHRVAAATESTDEDAKILADDRAENDG